ncbi:MAG: hypothetical protein R2932_50375 [Caldilineaceae bacterium]
MRSYGMVSGWLRRVTTIRLWRIGTGELERSYVGHNAAILGLRWNERRTQLLSYSEDGTARIWDIASGEEVRRFSGHTGALTTARWFADEERVLTAGVDGTVRQYFVELPDLLAAICQRLGPYTISEAEWRGLVGDIPYDGRLCQ